MHDFVAMRNRVAKGGKIVQVVESEMDALGNRTGDILTPEQKEAIFAQEISKIGTMLPYVEINWVKQMADQVGQASPEKLSEYAKLAYDNRERYAGTGAVDIDGNFPLWQAIHNGIEAVRTECFRSQSLDLS